MPFAPLLLSWEFSIVQNIFAHDSMGGVGGGQ